jgi:hypothetical protein
MRGLGLMAIEHAIQALILGQRLAYPNPDTFSPSELTSFTEFGVYTPTIYKLTDEQARKQFSVVRKWIQHVSDSNRINAVYLDTTTLYTVIKLALEPSNNGYYITPETLFDLSTFVNAVILFDRVFHLENKNLDSIRVNEALGNEPIVISLPIKSFTGINHIRRKTSVKRYRAFLPPIV